MTAGTQADQLTAVVTALTKACKTAIAPDFQISVDVAWSPNDIDGRAYDYTALGQVADLLFVMAYDMRSQVREEGGWGGERRGR